MVRHGLVRKIHDLINTIWTNRKPKDNIAKNTFEKVSRQGQQTIPYLLMTTLKITFYKYMYIKSVLVLVNHRSSFSYLRWEKGGVGGNLMAGQIFVHKDINNDYEDECYDFQDELFYFEQILRMSRDN